MSEKQKQQYDVTGMTCAACSAPVEKAVRAVPGVQDVTVSLLTNSMMIEGTPAPEAVETAVQKAGYGASLAGGGQTAADGTAENGAEKLRRQGAIGVGGLERQHLVRKPERFAGLAGARQRRVEREGRQQPHPG